MDLIRDCLRNALSCLFAENCVSYYVQALSTERGFNAVLSSQDLKPSTWPKLGGQNWKWSQYDAVCCNHFIYLKLVGKSI